MGWFDSHFLSILTFLPLFIAVIGVFVPKKVIKYWTFGGSLFVFLISLKLFFNFNSSDADFQFIEKISWIEGLGIQYSLGLDGISFWLILLTTFLMPIVLVSSFKNIETREKEYYILLLSLETGMLGAFLSLDLFLFYMFWEAMLIPMYFLIGIWGGKEKIYAATKFFIYTMVGSLLMLVAIFYLSYQHKVQFGSFSTEIMDLYKLVIPGNGYLSPQSILFLAFSFAFAIKVPLFPFHTWLPDAHVQAPTAGSVILAGVLLKMGGYGFLRFAFPLFPSAVHYYQNTFMFLGSIAIIYGALVAMVQTDIKKLVAYSSVSHMGYVVLGLFSLNKIGATGALYQMLNHGIATPILFLMIGMVYEQKHTREIKDYGGIAKIVPLFTIFFMIATLASIGLPGTNGFVGEFLILLGFWKVNHLLTILAATGVIFGAVYMLWMFQRVFFGPIVHKENEKLKDLNKREFLLLTPLIILIFIMGLAPNMFFGKMDASLSKFLERSTEKKIGKIE